MLGELQESSPSLPQQILAEIHFQIGPGRFEETMPTVSQLQLPRRRQAQPATALHQYSPACTRGGTASDPSPPALPQVAAKNQAHMSLMFLHMANLGYGVVSREDNGWNNIGCCSEYSFLKVEATPGAKQGATAVNHFRSR